MAAPATVERQLAHGEDAVIEADAAGRTAAGGIVLERTDQRGKSERVRAGTKPGTRRRQFPAPSLRRSVVAKSSAAISWARRVSQRASVTLR